ncbi:transport permease protein [Microlunatus endophyticus]|uniref:Transport permease protein n=1 Tax=Microlunatus endophyticus TaxID=1716077 RepID=A0A917S332_9ACTN|nr:ABC transporter permease [Microlunatus endophyticus]GGL49851.1 transport permease protein [Microlunatus endophyticus]
MIIAIITRTSIAAVGDQFTATTTMLGRGYRMLRRQPLLFPIMLVQPMVWLLLYSQLFNRLPRLGGFGTDSYLQFLAPGIAVISAFSHGAWEGPGMIADIERGALDRFLTTPMPPSTLVVSRTVQAAIIGSLQAAAVVAVAYAFGARPNDLISVLVILVSAALICAGFAAFSYALALLFRRQETMIAVGQFAVLPFMFLSATLTSVAQMPPWMQEVSALNPVSWAVDAARTSMLGTAGSRVLVDLAVLVLLVAAMQVFARFALGRYRRAL